MYKVLITTVPFGDKNILPLDILENAGKAKGVQIFIGSKNFFRMPFVAKKLKKIIEENEINILHVRSRAPAWLLKFIKYKMELINYTQLIVKLILVKLNQLKILITY